jgi:hypothetical protein
MKTTFNFNYSAFPSNRQPRNPIWQKVSARRGEDIDQDHLLIQHRRPVSAVRRKIERLARAGHNLLSVEKKEHAPAFDQGDLLMRVTMFRRDDSRREAQATEHQLLADDHLTFDPFRHLFDGDLSPVYTLRKLHARRRDG